MSNMSATVCVCIHEDYFYNDIVLVGVAFYWGGSVWKRRFDNFVRCIFSDLSFAIGRILFYRSIRLGILIFTYSICVWIFIDLFVKLCKMYLNCKYVIDREFLTEKFIDWFQSFVGLRIWPVWRVRSWSYFGFFMTFFKIVVMMGEVKLLGEFWGFEDDQSESGRICIVLFDMKGNISSKILVIGFMDLIWGFVDFRMSVGGLVFVRLFVLYWSLRSWVVGEASEFVCVLLKVGFIIFVFWRWVSRCEVKFSVWLSSVIVFWTVVFLQCDEVCPVR